MMSVICLAKSWWILVLRLVLAMLVKIDFFSSGVMGIFMLSRISRAFSLALSKPSGMKTLGDVEVRLLEELPDEQHSGGGSVPGGVVLSGGGAGDEAGSGVLDLHLVQQHVPVLGDLDVSRATNQHLHRALGAQVGLQHVLDTLSAADVHGQGLRGSRHLSLGIQHRYSGHLCNSCRSESSNI